MVKYTFTISLLCIMGLGTSGFAQTIDSVKSNPDFMWGQGKGSSLQSADRYALRDLTSQISTSVASDFQYIIKEQEGETTELLEGIVKTYSAATLTQAERIVEETPEGIFVLRYMKRSEVKNIFKQRANKIKGYVASAIEANNEGRVGDALRYYYWAQCLLYSHPDNQDMFYNYNGNNYLLYTWLPDRINRVLTLTQLKHIESIERADTKELLFDVLYENKQAYNLDYTFWNGSDWSGIISAPNGKGLIQLYGNAESNMGEIRIKIEYTYFNKSKLDPELHDVIEVTELPYYSKAVKVLKNNNMNEVQPVPKAELSKKEVNVANSFINDAELCSNSIAKNIAFENVNKLLKNIADNNHSASASLCTAEGYNIYKKLITYGKAKKLNSKVELKYTCMGREAIVRSVPFMFSFENNNQKFIENLSFTLNSEGLISNFTFALNDLSLQGILSKSQWPSQSKWHIIDFMENYKTAYALERLNYIESIFADNALIIIGKKLEKAESIDGMYKGALSNSDYEFIKTSKKDYIERLGNIFSNNEFVNIQFEESTVKKRDRETDVYGIQIAQNYFSSNYADKGYLFLMVDLKDSLKPKIYVRSWQPEKNADGSIIGLGQFFN